MVIQADFSVVHVKIAMSKTIIVSNRLPVSIKKENGNLICIPSAGGLATGLGSIYKSDDNLWIGWPGIYPGKNINEDKEIEALLGRENMIPVFLGKTDIKKFYEGFSNGTLWPLFHYFPKYTIFDQTYWQYYQQVNLKFCEKVIEHTSEDDFIWIHDYQLMLLPSMIRKQRPHCKIGYFQHIPFPSFEIFRNLPWRSELLKGLLGADLIGFHTYDDTRHCLSSINRILGLDNIMGEIRTEGRVIAIDAFPMGIDYEKYESAAKSEAVKEECESHIQLLKGNKVILSIDRLDYTKGLSERLHAVDAFLKRYPENIGKVCFVMIVVPSRENVGFYEKLKHEIDEKVGRINSKYRTIEWTPILYFYKSFSLQSLSVFYRLADIALITPLRDGMNLVAKEYIASRIDQTGVLIISEMAGAAKELSEAIQVNPNDTNQTVNALNLALNMSKQEQKRRNHELQVILRRYDIHQWVKMFMKRLGQVGEKQKELSLKNIDTKIVKEIIANYNVALTRILFLDYDGTLVAIKKSPENAKPDIELYNLLADLTANNDVVLISGRDKDTIEQWFGHFNMGLVAEHGAWIKEVDSKWKQTENLSSDWKEKILPILNLFVDRTPGAFIEHKDFSIAWHYRKSDPELGELRARELVDHLKYIIPHLGLHILEGKRVIEVKSFNHGKANAVQLWLSKKEYDFILGAGDDQTDEDIFKAMPDFAYSIKIGYSPSAAKYNIKSTEENSFIELRKVLRTIADLKPHSIKKNLV
jgi:trehalose 6-phosphate synthase/phosphatase